MFPDIPQYVCHAHSCICVGEDLTPLLAVPIFTTTFSARVQSNSRQTRSSSAAFLMTCALPRPPMSYLSHSSPYSRQRLTSHSTPAHPVQMWLSYLRARQSRHAPPPWLRRRHDPRRR